MSLYRKYRPTTFVEIIGQESIKQTLQNEIKHGAIVHAYLFAGPRAVGKTTMARVFSRALNCSSRKDGEAEPCNRCEACLSMLEGRALDLLEIDAASHTGVDHVRESIIAAARVANAALKMKIFIIDEVHMLSQSAFNALLKVLEEPPDSVVFILATTELHKVPATIISRCQRFDFQRIPPPPMIDRLKFLAKQEGVTVDDDVIHHIVRLSEGCQRDADSLLGQLCSLGKKKISAQQADFVLPKSFLGPVQELTTNIAEKKSSQALSLILQLVDDGTDIETFLHDLLEYLRALLLIKNNVNETVDISCYNGEQTNRLVSMLSIDRLLLIIDSMMRAQQENKWAYIPHLPLEIAVVRVCME